MYYYIYNYIVASAIKHSVAEKICSLSIEVQKLDRQDLNTELNEKPHPTSSKI